MLTDGPDHSSKGTKNIVKAGAVCKPNIINSWRNVVWLYMKAFVGFPTSVFAGGPPRPVNSQANLWNASFVIAGDITTTRRTLNPKP